MTKPHWLYSLTRLGWSGIDWLFPPRCGGCGKAGSRWCNECQAILPRLQEPLCESCGTPVRGTGLCQRCQEDPPPYRALRSWAAFDSPIRPALHKLKYRRDLGLGDALAVPIGRFVESLGWDFDMIVPIPLGEKRMKERGYNQIALIAKPLALSKGFEYRPDALQRRRETRSQVGLSATERRANVHQVFQADARFVSGKTILVMDDVATTGATISSSTEALLQAGAKEVCAVAVARALPHHGLHLV